jgi:hypothetical protein
MEDWIMVMGGITLTQEIEGLTGMTDQVLRERHGQVWMMKGMIQEGKGQIPMIEKVLPGSKGHTRMIEGIPHDREWQIVMRTMLDQEDHLGVADQCLQKRIHIGAGMNHNHHQGHPEVRHVMRCVVTPNPFPYISPSFPYVTWLCVLLLHVCSLVLLNILYVPPK